MLQIAPPFDVELLQRLYPATYQESMNTVLVQEALRYNGLLDVVAASIKECIKAVKGLVVMSPSLEAVCNSLYDNQVESVIVPLLLSWHLARFVLKCTGNACHNLLTRNL